MVWVLIHRGPDGTIEGFEVRGHAGWAEAGRDIVCAGVSALVQTAVLGLEERIGLQPAVDVAEGMLICRLPAVADPAVAGRAQDILETMLLGLRSMEMAYGDHVKVQESRAEQEV